MEPLLTRVATGPTIVGDGALGTTLMARGLRVQDCLESAVLSRPELIEEIAAAYLAAGSEVLTTDSFGASPLKLDAYGLAGRTEEINRRAVELLRGVAGNRAWIAGSVGPTGRILTPYGDTDPGEVAASFERQIGALAEAGADLIIVETMIDLAEARLAVAAAKHLAPSLPVVATMTFDATPRGFFTTMGTTIAEAAAGLVDAGADLVGSNCGNGIEAMVRIGLEFARATRSPIAIQSNAGLPQLVDGALRWPETPEHFAEHALPLVQLPVALLGGCCGTGPDHIRALRRLVGERAGRGSR
jgi:5-methyltetrahydrofolate--homocysteine methyltransferase